MKKYTKIKGVYKEIPATQGDQIVVWEKLDGANASIHFKLNDKEELETTCYSRRQKLSVNNTLEGFYWYVEDLTKYINGLNLDKVQKVFLHDLTIYGEWLIYHKVKYKEEYMKDFYAFDIYIEGEDNYGSLESLTSICKLISLNMAPVLYKGEFHNLADLEKYVGVSNMTVEPNTGEGIVIKNSNGVDYAKWVSEAFKEQKNIKLSRDTPPSGAWIAQYITEARVDKQIYKLRDENLLPEKDFKFFKEFAGLIIPAVWEDIMEEEQDNIIPDFNKDDAMRVVKKRVPIHIRRYIESV